MREGNKEIAPKFCQHDCLCLQVEVKAGASKEEITLERGEGR